MSDIQLTFINESNDHNNSEVVFFQKNEIANYEDLAIAWKVIQNCATGWKHKFYFPLQSDIGAEDSYGNEICNPIPVDNGQQFKVYMGVSGTQLEFAGEESSRNEIQLVNDLAQGSIDAKIYKDGRVIVERTGISPNQKAAFQLSNTLWVGVVSQVEEGQVMNSAIISEVNTKLGLSGIASADVIMSGGGTGADASPFTFTLENIVYA